MGEKDRMIDVLATPLSSLEMGTRLRNVCRNAGLVTAGQVASMEHSSFLTIKNCGRNTAYEMAQLLEGLGLHFGMDVEDPVPVSVLRELLDSIKVARARLNEVERIVRRLDVGGRL